MKQVTYEDNEGFFGNTTDKGVEGEVDNENDDGESSEVA